MAFTGAEKAFCELQIAKCESIVMVQRRFRTQYHKDPPNFHHDVRGYLNDTLPHRWIGRASQDDSSHLP